MAFYETISVANLWWSCTKLIPLSFSLQQNGSNSKRSWMLPKEHERESFLMVSIWVSMSDWWVSFSLFIRVLIIQPTQLQDSLRRRCQKMWFWNYALCATGERPDPEQIFRLTSLQNFSGGSGGGVPPPPISPAHTPSNNMGHRQVDTVLMETPQDTLVCPSSGLPWILCFMQRYLYVLSIWSIVWGHGLTIILNIVNSDHIFIISCHCLFPL